MGEFGGGRGGELSRTRGGMGWEGRALELGNGLGLGVACG